MMSVMTAAASRVSSWYRGIQPSSRGRVSIRRKCELSANCCRSPFSTSRNLNDRSASRSAGWLIRARRPMSTFNHDSESGSYVPDSRHSAVKGIERQLSRITNTCSRPKAAVAGPGKQTFRNVEGNRHRSAGGRNPNCAAVWVSG